MPVIRPSDAVVHEMHGTRFTSYAAPATGSGQLCAWHLDLPAGAQGLPHRITREEVLYVLTGSPRVTVDAEPHQLAAGDVLVAPAGSRLQVDNPGDVPATMWASTTVGFEAELPDGSRITPPWVR